MRSLSSWIAALGLLGCLALALLLWRQQREFGRLRAGEAAASGAAARQVEELRKQIASDRAIARARARPEGAGAPAPEGPRKTVHLADIVRDHPEMGPAFAHQLRQAITRQYGRALTDLGIPPDRLVQLEDLIGERLLGQIDLQMTARAEGISASGAALQDAARSLNQDVDRQIGALVGSDGTAFMDHLQSLSGGLNAVRVSYAPALEDAGVPLTPEQSRGLAEAVAAAQQEGRQRPAELSGADPSSELGPYDRAILERAAAVVSPAQLEAIRDGMIASAREGAIYRAYAKGKRYEIQP
ncbi:MAG TPA: hypothetical protein VHC86_16540 [Opitutaceae bacterium]|nr:hypothetical protein [Opitutaceae bacterium]